MSKKFHDIRNTRKMLQYGSANGMGPFRPKPKPTPPKPQPSETNTDDKTED